nr:MAG TPA: hypothetical protein [Caudoviricetes sp.]
MSWGEIKKAINSTLGTSGFLPLDKLIQYNIDKTNGKDVVEFVSSGNYTTHIPVWANRVRITAAAGGGGGYANNGGGGGGGAAILNNIYTISDALKNTDIRVKVGSGGSGAYYIYTESDGYTIKGPYDGSDTTITAFNIKLLGGKKGTRSAGGEAGGTGGGAGGLNSAGSAGISGAGGTGGAYSRFNYGGGGGSLGAGGDGDYNSSSGKAEGGSGTRGGGGGGAYANYGRDYGTGGNGGTGYVKFEWLL